MTRIVGRGAKQGRRLGAAVLAALAAGASGANAGDAAEDEADIAQEPSPLPARVFADARLRYEGVRDDAFALDADALTASVRAGLEISFWRTFSILAEFEGVARLAGEFDDAVGPNPGRAVVADADIAELNRFQLSTSIIPKSQLVLGRQHISLDDERFFGAVAFRQNEQTYDAARFTTQHLGPLVVDAGYVRRVNRILSRRSDVGRFRGDSYFVNVAAPIPLGQITGFHYALDLETGEGDAPLSIESSKTTGVRIDGRKHWRDASLSWEASYARQSEFADAPAAFSADYWLVGVKTALGRATLGYRVEVLGSGGAQAFQTPLGTLHKFQGAADVFLTTPDAGVEDRAVEGTWRFGDVGPLKNIAGRARYHWFEADLGDAAFGEEVNLLISARLWGTRVSAEYADYRADAFAEDVSRVWLTLERRL